MASPSPWPMARDAKFYDETGSINLAVWDVLINDLKPKTSFKSCNIATNIWNGKLKLTTTISSTFQPRNSETDLIRVEIKDDEKENENTILCCPEVIAVKLEEYFSCRNIVCRKKYQSKMRIQNLSSAQTVRDMVAKNLKHTFTVEVVLEKSGKQTNLTIFPNVLD